MDPFQVPRIILMSIRNIGMFFSPWENFLRDEFSVAVKDRLNKRSRLRRFLRGELCIKSLVEVGDVKVDVSEDKNN